MKQLLGGLLFFGLISLSWATSSDLNVTQVRASGLTERQAEQVLRFVLKQGEHRKILALPDAFIENDFKNPDGTQPVPGFYMFRLSRDDPKAGATAYFGTFVVSKKTADVWDVSLPSACKNLHFPALSLLQTAIMKRTKTAISDEKSLREKFDCFD